jgi:hypothetical protein
MEIKTIALELNKLSRSHPIGHLQELRTRLRGKPSRTHAIFTESTIFPDYAFHDGGRHEIQFNIGTEEINGREVFRYGIAFSLETSRSHPNVSELFPKIERFNYYIRTNGEAFVDFIMWYHSGPQKKRIRSSDFSPRPIETDWAKKGNFIFLGKWLEIGDLNLEDILSDLDLLLPLYAFVEGGDDLTAPVDKAVTFQPGCTVKKATTKALAIRTEHDISLRHNELQYTLYQALCQEYGAENVKAPYKLSYAGEVDVVVRHGSNMIFFEIKTAPYARCALREAVGQILEYAYWPNADRAAELVVVSEAKPTKETKQYLDNLRRRFGLRLSYRQLNNEKGELGPII